jgi:amino acid transporter
LSQQKKYGTFAGVFTPSILTILGVIMYLRMGSIVGNSSGILMTIGIILFAHIISVTTGLSVSSVATDKKIKAGGIYYMLSRSLGFPMGGAIGITIFVATALSISLYLIGFAESALVTMESAGWIDSYNINDLRLVGTIALAVTVGLAIISTSLAMKMQYVILLIIVLSLFSILGGDATELKVGTDSLSNISFGALFGIFFPAVTGFTAGVAMSGDLKDPKKSIPWGTMLAIATGLLVYISLAIFLDANINSEILATNNNAIVEYALVGGLVVAGIWGATLSSALGGILGAPRILQAMSMDKITPRMFGKGVGVNNEPRNALVLTAVISFAGILIGELNLIAEIVAMFYMAAYLFINVSCYVEQRTSPDFRPSFRIHNAVPLIGAIATFVLMIQLNLAATVVAFLFMGLLFLWLTKKDLELGSGDVWNSVWSSIVKKGLKNLQKKSTHKRNWEPNILLFSGDSSRREKLISISTAIAGGKKGMISNFDLTENKSAKVLFPKHQQTLAIESGDDTIFFRKQECKDIYRGIENIANTYGFSGIDPNTVMMGWSRNTKKPKDFVRMTDYLTQLDHNILFLDYDEDKGFGKNQTIDIWWSHFHEYCDLSLHIAKLMLTSSDWSQASIRILYNNNDNSTADYIHTIIESKVEVARINAEILVLNNELEQKSLYEMIRSQSIASDLIFIELPKFENHEEQDFISTTDDLLKDIGTTLVVRASSHFYEDINLDPALQKEYEQIQSRLNFLEEDAAIELLKSDFDAVNFGVNELYQSLFTSNKGLTTEVYKGFDEAFGALVNVFGSTQMDSTADYAKLTGVLEDFKEHRISLIRNKLKSSIREHLRAAQKAINAAPQELIVQFETQYLQPSPSDSNTTRKAKKRLLKKSGKQKLKFNAIVSHHLQNKYIKEYDRILNIVGVSGFLFSNLIQKWMSTGMKDKEAFQIEFKAQLEKEGKIVIKNAQDLLAETCNEITRDCINLNIHYINSEREEELGGTASKELLVSLNKYPNDYLFNQQILTNQLIIAAQLNLVKNSLVESLTDKEEIAKKDVFELKLNEISELSRAIRNEEEVESNGVQLIDDFTSLVTDLNREIQDFSGLVYPEIDIIAADSLNNFEKTQRNAQVVKISFRKTIQFIFEKEFSIPFGKTVLPVINELNAELSNLNKSYNLLKFSSQNKNQSAASTKEVKDLVLSQSQTSIENIKLYEQRISSEFSRFKQKLNKILSVEQILTNSSISQSQYSKDLAKSGAKKYISKTKRPIRKIDAKADEIILKLRDAVSKSTFEYRTRNLLNSQSRLSDFVDEVSLGKADGMSIPFYYQELFTGQQIAPKKRITNRIIELNRAEEIFNRYKEGRSGAVLFTGEILSGKSYVMQNAVNVFLSNVVQIDNEDQYGTSPSFEDIQRKSTGKAGGVEDILNQLADDTTIVINNLELFWNATPLGMQKFRDLLQVIEKYNDRLLFVMDCSIHFYNYAKQIFKLDNVILGTIVINPMSTNDLKAIIHERHQSGGLKYYWNKSHEEDMRPRKINQLFTRIAQSVEGNLGAALHFWLGSVDKFENNTIVLNSVDQKDIPFSLKPEWELMLYQIILHKSIKRDTLDELFSSDTDSFKPELENLIRSKVVECSLTNELSLNPYAAVFVVKYLRKNQIVI